MNRKSPTHIRKSPRQERSRATVEAILEAAARIFVESGVEGATTNRVARLAGVSIGSLYQYFPNKESLVQALLVAHLGEAEKSKPAALDAHADLTLRERIRLTIAWHLEIHSANPPLHEMLSLAAPRLLGPDTLREFKRSYQGLIKSVLEPHRHEMRIRDLDFAAFMVAECMESLTHGAVVHYPELLKQPELLDEMTQLIVGYLEGDRDELAQSPSR